MWPFKDKNEDRFDNIETDIRCLFSKNREAHDWETRLEALESFISELKAERHDAEVRADLIDELIDAKSDLMCPVKVSECRKK